LADRLAASPASISRQLNSLADAGYVRRERPTNMDNRAVVVVLTKEGREAWRTANTVYLRVVKKHFLSHLGDADVAAMRQAFDGILAE
ncbi:MAG TPA: transcriptional regulator, partial [Ilumatobacteraceae bacterium]|nr:transcriptional regulator [Ilumatobacteraceae bacterium]